MSSTTQQPPPATSPQSTAYFLTLMPIGPVALTRDALRVAIMSTWETTSFLGPRSVNRSFLAPVQKPNTKELPTLSLKHAGYATSYWNFIIPQLMQPWYIVTMLVSSTFQKTLFNINVPNTSSLTFTLCAKRLQEDRSDLCWCLKLLETGGQVPGEGERGMEERREKEGGNVKDPAYHDLSRSYRFAVHNRPDRHWIAIRKQLTDIFNSIGLNETIMQILNMFMSMGRPHHWVNYLMPEDARFNKSEESSATPNVSDVTKLNQLMMETWTVLSSYEFGNILEMSLRKVVDGVMEDMKLQFGDENLPLAKLLPRVAQISPLLLEEPSRNKFIEIIRNIPQVDVFFTLLYTNMPTS
ncbi:hypothetical protein E3N88_06634 [Mikania micrantha]|uniref:Uncharacterized protein n=1 Tax=Mikania micrantha TaxID=192012 RepID=A0A5N6PPA7_9ASTR|nr:hypothetical protein E3N88_06634 [Mikania micrantha]